MTELLSKEELEELARLFRCIYIPRCHQMSKLDLAAFGGPCSNCRVMAHIAALQAQKDEATLNGNNEMLDRIRGSIKFYPLTGGDVEVMKSIEAIVKGETAALQARVTELEADRERLEGAIAKIASTIPYQHCMSCNKMSEIAIDAAMRGKEKG